MTVSVVSRSTLSGTPEVSASRLESADVGVQLVFRHHPLGVAGEQVPVSGGEVVGDEQGWLVAADALHRDLRTFAADSP